MYFKNDLKISFRLTIPFQSVLNVNCSKIMTFNVF